MQMPGQQTTTHHPHTDKMADGVSIGSTEAANHLANSGKLGGGVINRRNTILNEIAEWDASWAAHHTSP